MVNRVLNDSEVCMNPVFWLILVGLVVVIGGVALYRSAQQGRHFGQMGLGFPRIQRAAFEQPGEGEPADLTGVVARQCFETALGFRLIYTCDCTETGGMLHHLSGQMIRPDRDRLARNMLLIFSMLLEQFQSAGVGAEGRFQIGESEQGTQHLEFELTAEEHEALRQVNRGMGDKPILIGANIRPAAEHFRSA